MTHRRRKAQGAIRTAVLTLRMTEEEMLRFKVAALGLGKRRSRIVRERVADLIGGAPQAAVTPPAPAATDTRRPMGSEMAAGDG